jgi:glycosyltransferase involved in cell wall biosynthesis
MLKETIASIFTLDYQQNKLEIIVVSQNEQLSSNDLATEHPTKLTVILADATGAIAKSRNIGAKIAQGEYLAFLDADIELSTNWLNVMFEQLAYDNNRKLVSAHQICHANATPLEKLRTELSNIELDVDVAFLPGRNLFLHRNTFVQVQGFPEHLVTCEDYYFTDQVGQLGTLFYSSAAHYIHLGEDKSWRQLFNKEIWRGQSNVKSLKGRNIPLREYPSLLVPFWVFFFAIFTMISSALMDITLLLSSLGALLLPVALYSFRLHRLTDKKLKSGTIVRFYLTYFIARALGTVTGIIKSINVRNGK